MVKLAKAARAAGLAALLLVAAAPAAAQRVEARFEPGRVALGETVDLVVAVSAGRLRVDVEDPVLPDLSDFEVLATGRSSEVRLVGTDVTRSTVFRYTLRPRRAGTLKIDPVRVRIEGEERYTPVPRLLVVDAADVRAAPEVAGENGPPAIFAVTRVDRQRTWAGSQLTLTFAFYHDPRVPLGESPDYDPPDTPGFWRVELDDAPSVAVERIGGRTYHVQRFRYALFPLRPGSLEIGPATVRVVEPDPERWWLPGRPRTIETEPLTVIAETLPPGAPPGYDGAVGRYRLSGSIDRRRAPAGTPLELEIVVEGTGNPTAVPPPDLPDWPEVVVGRPAVESTTRLDGGTVGGRTTFRFLLTPREAGSLDLGQARLTYFDPADESYSVDTLRLGEVVIDPGSSIASDDAARAVGPTLWEAREPTAPGPRGWVGEPWYWVALAGPWVAWLAAIGATRARRAARRAGERVRKPEARKRLAGARAALAAGASGAAPEAIEAIGDWIEAGWGVRPDASEPASVRARLESAGVPAEVAEAAVEARRRAAAVAYGGGDPAAAARAMEALVAAGRRRRAGRAGRTALLVLALVAAAPGPGTAAPAPGPAPAPAAGEPGPEGAPAGTPAPAPSRDRQPPPGAADLRARWEAANRAYREGDFASAAGAYAVLAARADDPRLEADRAGALWRAGEEGAAVAAYLRALEMDPRAWRVRADLDALRSRLGDPPTVAGPVEELLGWVRLDEWLLLLLALSWTTFGAALLARRRAALGPARAVLAGLFLVAAAAAALDAATAPASRAVAATEAPVAARPGGEAIGTIPEGAVAEVLEREPGAWRVRVPGAPAGWVASDRIVPLD